LPDRPPNVADRRVGVLAGEKTPDVENQKSLVCVSRLIFGKRVKKQPEAGGIRLVVATRMLPRATTRYGHEP